MQAVKLDNPNRLTSAARNIFASLLPSNHQPKLATHVQLTAPIG